MEVGVINSTTNEVHLKTTTFGVFIGPKRISDIELMQFTGLTDKNGKEIYEGDVVEFNQHPAGRELVKWDKEYSGFLPMADGSSSDLCEVVGNCFENPDLLK